MRKDASYDVSCLTTSFSGFLLVHENAFPLNRFDALTACSATRSFTQRPATATTTTLTKLVLVPNSLTEFI